MDLKEKRVLFESDVGQFISDEIEVEEDEVEDDEYELDNDDEDYEFNEDATNDNSNTIGSCEKPKLTLNDIIHMQFNT